jgi:hypothetical protein
VSPVAAPNVADGFGFLVTQDSVLPNGSHQPLTTGIAGVRVGRALNTVIVTGGSPADVNEVTTKVLPAIEQRLQQAQR